MVWNPGDSLSPPDISPVRPLIRQAGQGWAHLTCGLQCLGGGLPRHPSPGCSALANSGSEPAPPDSPLPPDRPSAAAPAEPRPELGFVYSRREYILQLS